MTQLRWRDSPDIVARMIDSGSIQSWSAKDIVLKPNETCVIMADGKVQDILSETVLKNYVGGFSRWLGSKVGMGSRDHKLIFAMTGPLDVLMLMNGQTADGESVKGMLNIRLQIQRDDVPKLINIFTNNQRELNVAFFERMYSSEVLARVLQPLIAKQENAAALRGANFQDALEMGMRAEMRASFDQYGITLLKAFAVINESDMEKLLAYKSQTETMMARADVVNEASLAAIEREKSITLARILAEAEVAKAQARGQVEAALETELLELRKQEAEMAAQRHDMAERQDIEISGEQSRMNIAMGAFEQVQAAKRARMAQQSDAVIDRQAQADQVQTDMMRMAAEQGALTPEVMQTFLEQQSAQKAHDQTKESTSISSVNCASCGNEIQTNWNACPHCGTSL